MGRVPGDFEPGASDGVDRTGLASDADPARAIAELPAASRRKWRLFACACVRLCWDHLADPAGRRLVEAAEAVADRVARRADLAAAIRETQAALVARPPAWHLEPATLALGAAAYAGWAEQSWTAGRVGELTVRCLAAVAASDMPERRRARARGHRAVRLVMHDVFGNPFRRVRFDLRWRTADTVGLARGIYEDRAFDRLPLLRDALMDAGCADEAVLTHTRRRAHVRGCWLLDRILDKK